MDLNLLKAFVVVAREGGLTRAAAQLHVTQSAVSLQIKNLQQALGVAVFTRGSRGLSLTTEGRLLLPIAERTLAAANELALTASSLRLDVAGRLRIGTILDPEFLRLGGFLQRLVESWPRVETALCHGMSGWVLNELRSGQLDVGYYIRGADDDTLDGEGFTTIELTRFRYFVLAPAGWKDRLKGARDWSALANFPWIWTPPVSAHQLMLKRCFDEFGIAPVKVAEVDQEQSMLELVKSGVGLTLARDSVALAVAHSHALTIVDGVTIDARLCFVARADRVCEPTIAAAINLIRTQWSQ